MKRVARFRWMWNLPRLLKTSWALWRDPRVPVNRKAVLALLGLGYLILPLDLIVDVIPLLGQIDDLGVLFFLLNWFVNRAATSTDDLEAEYYIKDDKNDPKK